MCFFVDLLLLLGRILFAFVFAYLGIDQLLHWSDSLEFFKDFSSNTANLLLITGLMVQFFGAFSLFFGVKTRLGAFGLLLYVTAMALLPINLSEITQAGHEAELKTALHHALSVAGLLYVFAAGSGRCSYDWLFGKRSCCSSRCTHKETSVETEKEPSKT